MSLVVVESRERGSFLLYHTKREREREREECLTGRRITLSYLLLAWSHTHTGMMTLLELHNGLQYIVHSRTPSALNSSESSGRRKRECIAYLQLCQLFAEKLSPSKASSHAHVLIAHLC